MASISLTRTTDGTVSNANANLNNNWTTLENAINGGLDASNLAADSVGSSEIAANAVTTTEILDAAVTLAKLAASSVDSSKVAAGVPWVGFHTFRHTCATTLFRRGLNAKQVQVWLGHHSPAFTLATYVHFLDDDLPSADFLDGVTAAGNNGNGVATRRAETELRALGADESESPAVAGESLGELRLV